MKEWLVARGGDSGSLSCSINKGGRSTIRRLTDQAVLHVLKKRAVEASVASFSPHDLRRSFISDLLDAGANISTAQQLAGHFSVQTKARYDRRGQATKRKAAELLYPLPTPLSTAVVSSHARKQISTATLRFRDRSNGPP